MKDVEVVHRRIGESYQFKIILPYDFATYADIEVILQSMSNDKQVIYKAKKVPAEGYDTLVVDSINPKATNCYVDYTQTAKAYAGIYEVVIKKSITNPSYSSGVNVPIDSTPLVIFE